MRFTMDTPSAALLNDSMIEVISNEQLRSFYHQFRSIYQPPPPVPVGDENTHTSSSSSSGSLYDIGHMGERFVYHYLQHLFPQKETHIQWLNAHEESKAGYDILLDTQKVQAGRNHLGYPITKLTQQSIFIEVKTTRYVENNVFALSWWEWIFAMKEPRVHYHLYRVFAINSMEHMKIVVLKDLSGLIQQGRVKLCLAI